MKKSVSLFLLLCLVLCFGIAYAASAESPLSAKQLVLAKLQSDEPAMDSDLYITSSGTATYEIKALNGLFIQMTGSKTLGDLEGTKLKVDYKMNAPGEMLEANYAVGLQGQSYGGNVYMNQDKIIFSTEIVELFKALDPAAGSQMGPLPRYLYTADPNFKKMWENIIRSKGQNVPPEMKDLLVFILEGVPDQYFTVSLVNQTVTFHVDQKGAEDVTLAVLLKVKNERERFAALTADMLSAYGSTPEGTEAVKKDILDGIEKGLKDGTFPDTKEEVREALSDIRIEDLTCESSLLPSGPGKITAVMGFGDETFTGKINLTVNYAGSSEKIKGDYALVLTAMDPARALAMDGQIRGEFTQTPDQADSTALFDFRMKDQKGNANLFNLSVNAVSQARVDKNVVIQAPVLTATNSALLDTYFQGSSSSDGVKVVLDGNSIFFDVDPFIQDGRTMVPLRELSEKMGYQVTWVEPDQIILSYADKTITMYVNRQGYTVNGTAKKLDVPPFIKDGKRTVVPIRFIAEEFGCQVEYEPDSKTVFIYSQ